MQAPFSMGKQVELTHNIIYYPNNYIAKGKLWTLTSKIIGQRHSFPADKFENKYKAQSVNARYC